LLCSSSSLSLTTKGYDVGNGKFDGSQIKNLTRLD
jgi:hypothetical protein